MFAMPFLRHLAILSLISPTSAFNPRSEYTMLSEDSAFVLIALSW